MKIALITTLSTLEENRRIGKEIESLGHKFTLIDLQHFSFEIDENGLSIGQLADLETDLVIVRGIFNAIKPLSVVIEDLKKKGVKVFDNNLLSQFYSIDKITDLLKLSTSAIPTPNTSYARDFARFPEMAKKLGYPVVIKSTRMGKGASVFKVSGESELEALIQNFVETEREAKGFIMQEFIPYEFDLRALIIGKNIFVMRRLPGPGEFRANFSLGGSVELFDLDQEGKELAFKALHAVGLSVGGVDILIDKNNSRYILEVNHTAGMLGMEKATGKNITRMYVEHAIKYAK